MKRHKSLIPLSQFHRSCLFLALVAKENAPSVKGYPTDIEGKIAYAISFYHGPLQKHFDQEAVLWKYVSHKSERLDQVLTDLAHERKILNDLFNELSENKVETILNQIGILLEKHVRKEERVLFQQIQNDLTEEELSEVEALLA